VGSTVWVTGAAGFTGHHLISHLRRIQEDLTIVGLDLSASGPDGLDAYYQLDLLDFAGIREQLRASSPDRVFHLAGLLPPRTEGDLWQVNVGGTLNLIQAIGMSGLKPVILSIGSAAEYLPNDSGRMVETDPGPGLSGYGRVKWAQTQLALALGDEYQLDVRVARPFNLVGPGLPGSLVAAQFCQQFAMGDNRPIKVGNVESARDFIDIRDAVSAYWQIIRFGRRGEVYNVATGSPTRIAQLLEIFSDLSGGKHEIVVDQDRVKSVDIDVIFGVCDKLRQLSDWQPEFSLEQSLEAMFAGASR
jgi:GDP-4-dehydro-6-deoxy-D-mannose reductase